MFENYDRAVVSSGLEIEEFEETGGEPEVTPSRWRGLLDPERLALPALVILGALLALADDAEPTGWGNADSFWRAVAGAAIVICGAFAPPAALLVSAGAAAASSSEAWLIAVGAVTVLLAAGAAFRYAYVPWAGALVGLGVSWIVFRLPHTEVMGLSTLVAAAIVGVLLFGAWFWGPDGVAKYFTWAAVAIAVGTVLAVLVLAVTLFRARNQINDALDLADDAVASFRDGDEVRAREQLADAVDLLGSAEEKTGARWVDATRLVPVIAQHTEAVQTVVTSGLASAEAAQVVLDEVDRDELAIKGGAVNLDAIRDIEPAVADLAAATAATRTDLASVRSRWLLGPMRSALDDANDEIDEIADASDRAADAARLAPGMLGGDGPRNHLVLLVTPSELRGSGGLIGNWALIEALDGRLDLQAVGRAQDINDLLVPQDLELTRPVGYVARYAQNQPESEFWDITLSPHFPDVANVAAQLFEAATDTEVDSVMLVDPEGLAALMELTGPVRIDNATMTSDNVARFLLVDQYASFADDDDRTEFLERLVTETFENLLAIDFQDPWDLDEVFGDVVDEDRLVITSLNDEEQILLDRLGVTGSFPTVPEGSADVMGVLTQNGGQNKADAFLERRIGYDALLDPLTGELEGTITVSLTNDLANMLLPEAIVGSNDQGLPRGTNRLAVTVYSPHALVDARLDGVETGMQVIPEFGLNSFNKVLDIGPGETVELEIDVAGQLDVAGRYRLVVPVQPTANPDRIRLRLRGTTGTRLDGSLTSWQTSLRTSADQRYVIDVEPPG